MFTLCFSPAKCPPQAEPHTEEDIRDTLQPIAQILQNSGEYERAGAVLREWIGVSSEPTAARDAFCGLLEASPSGLASLEFASNSKGHWKKNVDRRMFERVIALAVEDHRHAAVLSINLSQMRIGGVCRLP